MHPGENKRERRHADEGKCSLDGSWGMVRVSLHGTLLLLEWFMENAPVLLTCCPLKKKNKEGVWSARATEGCARGMVADVKVRDNNASV
jgi:hypothetical protein